MICKEFEHEWDEPDNPDTYCINCSIHKDHSLIIEKAFGAMSVITTDVKISKYLRENDPKSLDQLNNAILSIIVEW